MLSISEAKTILNKETVSVDDLAKLLRDRPGLFEDKRDAYDKLRSELFFLFQENKITEEEHDNLSELIEQSNDDCYYRGEKEGAEIAESDWSVEDCRTCVKTLIDLMTSEKKTFSLKNRIEAVSRLNDLTRYLETPDSRTKAVQWLRKNS